MHNLWYKWPARKWIDALPIGNGRMGAMIYGGKRHETIAVNDCTLWSGYPKDHNNPESAKYLSQVRQLILEGKNDIADKLAIERLSGGYSESYLPLGKINIDFSPISTKPYKRELDISKSVFTVTSHDVYREAFASYPDDIIAYKISSKKEISLTISMTSKLLSSIRLDGDILSIVGNAPDIVVPNYVFREKKPVQYMGNGMSFCMSVRAIGNGEIVSSKDSIKVVNATNVTLYIFTATGFIGYDKMPITDYRYVYDRCINRLKNLDKDYDSIKYNHIQDYQSLYLRQSFSLFGESSLPTDKLLKRFKKYKRANDNKAIVELMYNYGKYLTISGSREDTQPLNLQGIWNNKVRPPWSSNYTTNINTQMNYWGASQCGLDECLHSFLDMVYELYDTGAKTAAINYNSRGFCCNHNTDLWRKTSTVIGTPNYMYAPLSGVWLVNELVSHYKRGCLKDHKEKICLLIEESCKFVIDYLIRHKGYYITCPSASPEAEFYNDDGHICHLDYASSYELGLIRQLIKNYNNLIPNGSLSDRLEDISNNLYPFKKGSTGILEWHKDYTIKEKGHRHFSPLYCFYPGDVIGYYSHPIEREWINQLFQYRLSHNKSNIGWCAAWTICIAARLRNKDIALKTINEMVSRSIFKNLLDIHQPWIFQIDGNLGFIAGINEMIVTEEDGLIDLLPAVPSLWDCGEIKNLLIKGSKVSLKWNNGKISYCDIQGDTVKLRKNLNNHA